MIMEMKPCVLISGQTIAADEKLIRDMEKSAKVLINQQNENIKSILAENQVELILFEMTKEDMLELSIIKNILIQYPQIQIVLIDGSGDQELLAGAFTYGVKDAFRKPYKRDLVVERIFAILK